ncbi:MAG TPA: glutamate--tRNA ligase [Solirubrobacteraceae bacterium]|nr:glutamate--tRNA ligase [Solirubrobacteraceae bacterium]
MRVRFAPSPTGALHIGGARTALYNQVLARGNDGTLVLRIEDTDRERSTPENVAQILEALTWLGIGWDEGPILQSERAGRHRQVLDALLADGHAYRSSATTQDVQAYKAEHGADRGFRGTPEPEGAVRLRVPDEGFTVVHDAIRGDTRFEHVHLDDPVIARADGSVLYNFAVAVDDLDAGITHVVRGEDHLSNTPKQLLVFEAVGETPPIYAHVPLLHGPDGKKLSKRHGAASVQELRDAGYLPEAVRNYVALLGWGPDETTTFMTSEEMAERFDLARVSRNPAVFDEQKLRWMNGRYLRELPLEELTARLEAFTGRTDLAGAAEIAQDKISTLAEFWPLAGFLFDGPAQDPAAFEKWIAPDEAQERLTAAREALAAAEPFEREGVEAALRGVVERLGVKPKAVFQPLRVALAGGTVSPGIFETVALLGREETLRRVDAALTRTRS